MLGSLFELMIVIGITAPLFIGKMQQDWRDAQDLSAQVQGVRLSQYNNAVASWLVAQEEKSNLNGTPIPYGTYTGTAWLKPSVNCPQGQADGAYLICGWSDFWSGYFESPPETVVTQDFATGRAKAETSLGQPRKGVNLLGPYGGLMVKTASAQVASVTQRGQLLTGITSYQFDASTNWSVRAIVDLSLARDPWLRIDGANGMAANLNMNHNDIVNGRNATFSGDVSANNVYATTEVTAVNGDVVMSNTVHKATTVKGGTSPDGADGEPIPKPVCPPGKIAAVNMSVTNWQSNSGIEGVNIAVYDGGTYWAGTLKGLDDRGDYLVLKGYINANPYCR